jgi:hypothetical protein
MAISLAVMKLSLLLLVPAPVEVTVRMLLRITVG